MIAGEALMLAAFLAGRVLFGLFHLSSGFNHFKLFSGYAQHAASKRVPLPKLAIAVSGLLLIIGGASVLLGYQPRIGIAALVLFYVPVTPVMHNFWAAAPEHKQGEMVNFMKNVALLGATLMLLAIPQPWAYSV